MPELSELLRYLVSGLAFGAVYAVSGTGLVILYRTTGVLNFAFGAVGAIGAHIAWSLLETDWCPTWVAYLACIAFGGVVTLLYGRYIAPQFSQRDPLTRAIGTLGLALIILGIMFWRWRSADARRIELPMKRWKFTVADNVVNGTQVTAVLFGILVTAGVAVFLRKTAIGTAMRAVANDRDIASLLGIPVRRVEALAWVGNGVICGVVGLLLSEMFRLDGTALTFFIIPALAASLVGQLRNLGATFAAGFAIGVVEAELTGFDYKVVADHKTMTPFVIAIGALLWFGRRRTIVLSGRAMQ